MKEPYGEGVANHSGPESCGGARKGTAEAWTGVRAGRVLSPEKPLNPGADAVVRDGRQHCSAASARRDADPAWSLTPSTHGNSANGNRESLESAAEEGAAVRAGNPKGASQR